MAVLDTAVGAEYQFHLRSRRGVEAQEFRQSRYKNPNTRTEDARSSSYKSGKINPEESVNRQPESQSNESPYLDKLFTMTASYKVASDKIKPSKQVGFHPYNQNPGTEGEKLNSLFNFSISLSANYFLFRCLRCVPVLPSSIIQIFRSFPKQPLQRCNQSKETISSSSSTTEYSRSLHVLDQLPKSTFPSEPYRLSFQFHRQSTKGE